MSKEELNTTIPATSQSFYPDNQTAQIKGKMDTIMIAYGNIINNISAITFVPADIIRSVIFIESAGNSKAYNSGSGATGLMQVTPTSATDTVVQEIQRGRLTDPEKQILKKHLGDGRFNTLMKYKLLGQPQIITKEDLLDPELNILIGCLALNLLVNEHTEGGKVRLDKVIVRYNNGYFFPKSKLKGTTDELLASSLPTETKNYITKLVGTNGTLDLIS